MMALMISITFEIILSNSYIYQKLLDVEDVCDIQKPDERSVMTYVAQYFHAFSELGKRRRELRVVYSRVRVTIVYILSAFILKHRQGRDCKKKSCKIRRGHAFSLGHGTRL